MIDRTIGVVVALVLCGLGAPLAAGAQEPKPGKMVRIGRLSPLSAETDRPFVDALRRGMRDLGWVDGRNFTIESRFAEGRPDRLAELAAELVRQRVDIIVTGSNPGALAAKKATGAIPIVMVTTGDPVGGGLVASLARPGGNVTGVTASGQELSAKRLELLKEVVPGAARVAVLVNPTSSYTGPFLGEREGIARALRWDLRVVEAQRPGELEKTFAAMTGERIGALMVLTDIMFITHRRRIVELAAKSRLPAVYFDQEFVDEGGLMFYGASLIAMYRHAAVHVDKILKGVKPADLPVEQPTTFELVLNLRTAKALGLTIPPSVLARADRVLE
jgi:putative ABC transport system substrate-binding protein